MYDLPEYEQSRYPDVDRFSQMEGAEEPDSQDEDVSSYPAEAIEWVYLEEACQGAIS